MFLFSLLSQSPNITLSYNIVYWHSTTVIVVHLGQGAQGLPSGPQGPIGPSQHYILVIAPLYHQTAMSLIVL